MDKFKYNKKIQKITKAPILITVDCGSSLRLGINESKIKSKVNFKLLTYLFQ